MPPRTDRLAPPLPAPATLGSICSVRNTSASPIDGIASTCAVEIDCTLTSRPMATTVADWSVADRTVAVDSRTTALVRITDSGPVTVSARRASNREAYPTYCTRNVCGSPGTPSRAKRPSALVWMARGELTSPTRAFGSTSPVAESRTTPVMVNVRGAAPLRTGAGWAPIGRGMAATPSMVSAQTAVTRVGGRGGTTRILMVPVTPVTPATLRRPHLLAVRAVGA